MRFCHHMTDWLCLSEHHVLMSQHSPKSENAAIQQSFRILHLVLLLLCVATEASERNTAFVLQVLPDCRAHFETRKSRYSG